MVLSTSTSSMHSWWIHLLQQHSSHSCPVSISSSYVPKQTQQMSVWIVSSMSPLALFRLGRGAMLEVGFLFRAFSSDFFCFSSAFLTFAASLSTALQAFSSTLHQPCVSVRLLFATFSTLSPVFIFLFLLLLSTSDFPSLSKAANIHCWLEHELFLF